MRIFIFPRFVLNIYSVPCLLLLVARAYALSADQDGEGAATSSAQTLLLLLSYSVAFVNVMRSGGMSVRFIFVLAPLAILAALAALTSIACTEPIIAITHAIHFVGLFFVAVNASLWACVQEDAPMDLISLIAFAVGAISILYVIIFPETGLSFADAGPWASRWNGATANPNFLGALAFVLLWVGLCHFSTIERSRSIIYALLCCFLAIVLLLGSDSRTAIASGVFMIAIFFLMKRHRPIDRHSFVLRMFLALLGAVVLALALGVSGPGVLGSYLSSETREGASDSLSGRPEIWRLGVEAFAQRPFFGWGYDDLNTFWFSHVYIERFVHFHNGFLNEAVFGGIIGLTVLIWMLGRMLASAYMLWPLDPHFSKMSLIFYLANIIYNTTETGFNRTVFVWPVMVIIWAITEAKLSALGINRRVKRSAINFSGRYGSTDDPLQKRSGRSRH